MRLEFAKELGLPIVQTTETEFTVADGRTAKASSFVMVKTKLTLMHH